jgi:hypothetical protein
MPVPGPAARLWRDRPRLVAVGLLAVVAVAASALQSTSATVLQQTLDENWRGTYDILVTQGGKNPVTAGLLRSDALVDATMGRLSMDDLALIRGLPGVDVAAPVGEVVFAQPDLIGDPVVWLPVPVNPKASLENPEAFRITISSTVGEGTAVRELASQTVNALAYQPTNSTISFDQEGHPFYVTTPLADGPRLLSADETMLVASGNYDPTTRTIPLGLSLAPRPAATIALVDPVAERALLGEAGSFLDPLVDYSKKGTQPVVVLDRTPSRLQLAITVERFTDVVPGHVGGIAAGNGSVIVQDNGQVAPTVPRASPTTVIATYSGDASAQLDPFATHSLLLGNVTQQQVATAAPQRSALNARSLFGARYEIPDDVAVAGTGARLLPRGYTSYSQYDEAPLSGAAAHGSVTDYSKLFGAVGTGTQFGDKSISQYFDVVGSFRPADLRALTGATSFMPLGGYDVETPQLVAGPDGLEVAVRTLDTSITGFGIPGTNDMAVGSFAMLDGMGVQRPISAIRVRVAGIGAYTPDAQGRLLAAASALGSLGYHATVVAGSSPQKLRVLVTGYAAPIPDSSGRQPIGDLGYIEQDWSRLGAVTEVDAAISATSVALLAVSILSVGVLLAVVQLGSIPARRANAGVLRQLGWRRRRIVGWNISVELVALLCLAVVGALAVAFSMVQTVAAVSVGLSLGLVALTSLAAVLAGARAPRRTARRQRARDSSGAARVNGPIAFGARQARSQVAHSVSLGLAVLMITVSVAIAVTVFVQGRQLAGPTLLGAVASARGWLPQGILAGGSLAAGVVLAVLSRRMGVERRREQWEAIRAMGWSTADVTRAHLAELAFSAVPGALLGVAIAAGVAVQVQGILGPVLVVSGLGAVLAVAVVLFSGRRLS